MDKRIPSLDGLRAIAVSMVLFTHLWTYPAGYPLLNTLAGSGWLGVDLFFVLSGFLITGILVRTRENTDYFRTFYIRRSIRIFPPYYALLLVVLVVLAYIKPLPAALTRDSWMYWFYLSNFALAGGWQLFLLDITWSLAIEEQFYLVWPTLVRWIDRLAPLCICVIIATPLARYGLWQMGVKWSWMHMMMPLRADAFAWGALLALRPKSLASLTWLLVPIAVLDVTGHYGRDSEVVNTIGYSLNAMCAAGIIGLALQGGRFATLLSWRPARYVGQVSYGIYLYHPVCLMAVSMVIPRWGRGLMGGILQLVAVSAVALGVASASFYIFERPIGRLKDRFEPGGCPSQFRASARVKVDFPANSP